MTTVDILLSTYNNILFLDKLIDSLKTQTYKNFNLLVRDDGSSFEIKKNIYKKIENIENVKLIDCKINKGYFYSFNELINLSNSELIFLCDQDDIWHKDKLSIFIKEFSKIKNKNIPVLMFSDLNLIDEMDKIIPKSFFKIMKFNPKNSYNTLLLRNSIPGCTIAINQELKNIYQSVNKIIPYHDHILVILALFYGKIIYIDNKLISYRIHNNNALAKINYSFNEVLNNFFYIIKFKFSYKNYLNNRYSTFLEQIRIISESQENIGIKTNFDSNLINKIYNNKNIYFKARDYAELFLT